MQLSKLIVTVVIITFFSSAMELPIAPSSKRRPVEESMFELFVQQKERMDSLDQNGKDASVQALELSAQSAQQRVNSATAQLQVDQANRKQGADLLKLVIENQGNSEQVNQKLREQLAEQAQEISGMRNQVRDINAGHQQLQIKAAENTELIKWVYIAGGVAVLGGGIALLALAAKSGKLEDDQKKLSDQVAGLKWKVDLKEHSNNSTEETDRINSMRRAMHKGRMLSYQREEEKRDVVHIVNDLKEINEELKALKATNETPIKQNVPVTSELQKKVETIIENTDKLNENLTFLILKDRVNHLEKQADQLAKRSFVSQQGAHSDHLVLNIPNQQNPAQVETKPIKDAKVGRW